MGGLVGYESSDDEQEAQPLNQPQVSTTPRHLQLNIQLTWDLDIRKS
jgi:hypothetical protein